jgi:hypothetical protein
MGLKALDIAVFMVILSISIIFVPPAAAPQWAASINLGPLSTLNTANTYNLEALAASWSAFTGSTSEGISWLTIVEFSLLSLRMLLEGLIIAALILVAPIGILFALQATFPMIPSVIFILIGAVVYIIFGWAWFQILTGRGGEVLT